MLLTMTLFKMMICITNIRQDNQLVAVSLITSLNHHTIKRSGLRKDSRALQKQLRM